MALIAAVAAAVTIVSAAAANGYPIALMAALLIPGVALTAAQPTRQVRLPERFRRRAILLFGLAGLLFYASRVTPQHARYLVFVAVALSLLWPTREHLFGAVALAVLSLAAVAPSLGAVGWPLAGVTVGAVVTLVASNALLGPKGHQLAGRGRRVARDAAAVVAIAGLLALLVAMILPDPKNPNQQPRRGAKPRGSRQATAPYLQPTDQLDAGGPGTGKGDQVVFRVNAPRTALWRTTTFDAYDGRTWRRTLEFDAPGIGYGGLTYVPGSDADGEAYQGLVQRIRIEAPAVGLLPAAPRLGLVRLPKGVEAAAAPDSSVEPVPPLGKGATYTATSYPPVADPEALRHAEPVAGVVGDYDGLADRYLPLPDVPERVRQLAGEITANAPTDYDRVAAVEAWLRANTHVALDAPAIPAGLDPVDQFLFTDRRGSAQQAASAMAVMLRSLGLPARIAVGYVSPAPSPFGGEIVVRARHAHAWVEAWFPNAGWVAFDPAGRFTARGQDAQSLWSRLKRLLQALWWLPIALAVAAAAWLVTRYLRRRRQRGRRPWATQVYERLTRVGAKRGRPRRPGETPAEYCAALGAHVDDDRLGKVGELVTTAAWSREPPAAPDRAWVDDVVHDLQK